MTADEFTAFVNFVREEYGVFENALAKSMGFSRQVLARWRKKGSPCIRRSCSCCCHCGSRPLEAKARTSAQSCPTTGGTRT